MCICGYPRPAVELGFNILFFSGSFGGVVEESGRNGKFMMEVSVLEEMNIEIDGIGSWCLLV
jgi:hypothetical protein